MVRFIDTIVTNCVRVAHFFNLIPLWTLTIISLITIMYIVSNLFGQLDISQVCFRFPQNAFDLHRILSSILFHKTFGHYCFNVLTALTIGLALEHKLGTVWFFTTTMFFQLCSSFLRLALHSIYPIKVCTVGFSGILFALMIVAVYMETVKRVRVLSLFIVIAIVPWMFALFLEIFMPHTSFTCNLSGIISGYLFVYFIMNSDWWREFNIWIEKLLPSMITESIHFASTKKQSKTTTIPKNYSSSFLTTLEYLFSKKPSEQMITNKKAVLKYKNK